MRTIKVTIEEKYIDIVKERLQDIPGVSIEDAEARKASVQNLRAVLNNIPTYDVPEDDLHRLVQNEIGKVRNAKQ